MDYDNVYQENENTFGNTQTPIVKIAADIFKEDNPGLKGIFLDLGCGQGRDSIYMAKRHFAVEAVDSSSVALGQLVKRASDESLDISVKNINLEDFVIEYSKYSIISAINVLHFIDRENILKTIDKMKRGLTKGGLVAISVFTGEKTIHKQELLEVFTGFDVLYYIETVIKDNGHPGCLEKHEHQVARILAKNRTDD